MRKKTKRIAILVGSMLAVLILATALAAWLLLDTDRIGEQLESGLGEALEMDVQIGRPPRFGLLRGVRVRFGDIEARRDGELVATAADASARLSLFSLLTGNVRLIELHIDRPDLSVERYGPGMFNVYEASSKPETLEALSVPRVRVTGARLTWLDQPSTLEWVFADCDLDLRNIAHAGGPLEQALATLDAEGELKCGTVSQEGFSSTGLSAEIRGENGIIALDPIDATVLDGTVSARFEADLSSATPRFTLEAGLSALDLGTFLDSMDPEQSATGTMDLELDLDGQGSSWQEIRTSMAGSISLSAGELVLEGLDLDEELDDYASTQRFNLIDVGATLLAGPIGLAASRGYAFSGMLGESGGSTSIDRMVSDWTVEGGTAKARDVAFRTSENRLALAGALNFGSYRFDDLRVAVVDRDGCAIVEQRVTGPFGDPEIDQPNFLVAVAGPLLDLVKRGVESVTKDDCRPFYTGSIAHP